MKKNILLATSVFLTAIANELNKAAGGATAEPQTDTPPEGSDNQETQKPRRGRPPGSTASNKTESDKSPENTPPPEAANGKLTYDQLRDVVTPMIKAGRQPDVVKIIAKYAEGGLKAITSLPAEKIKEFVAEVEAEMM